MVILNERTGRSLVLRQPEGFEMVIKYVDDKVYLELGFTTYSALFDDTKSAMHQMSVISRFIMIHGFDNVGLVIDKEKGVRLDSNN